MTQYTSRTESLSSTTKSAPAALNASIHVRSMSYIRYLIMPMSTWPARPMKGASLRKICNIGCIGCKICEKTCQYDAIHVTDNLADIDYDKCTGCGECAIKCPRKLIVDSKLDRTPVISDKIAQ